MVKFSIVIPMYNVSRFLEKCIHCLYLQNLQETEFELILVDDGSPDDSGDVARKLTAGKNNAKIITQQNKGLGGARNTGIANASGQYILFLDADDWYLDGKLQDLYTIAENHQLDILEFGAQGIDPDGNITYTSSVSSDGSVTNGMDYYKRNRYMDSACNKLYSRSFLNENNLSFIEKIYIEDFEFNTRAFFYASRVTATEAIIAQFLQSSDSITRTTSTSKIHKMKDDIIDVIRRVKQFANGKETSNLQKEYFNQRLNHLVASLFYQLVKNRAPFKEFKALKNQLVSEDLFYVNGPIFDSKKNFFRKWFLKNFFMLKILTLLRK